MANQSQAQAEDVDAITDEILAQLQCPRQKKNKPCKKQAEGCPFGHRPEGEDIPEEPPEGIQAEQTQGLTIIPKTICRSHLIGKCTKETETVDTKSRCKKGFHPGGKDLRKLLRYDAKQAQKQQSAKQKSPPVTSLKIKNSKFTVKSPRGSTVKTADSPTAEEGNESEKHAKSKRRKKSKMALSDAAEQQRRKDDNSLDRDEKPQKVKSKKPMADTSETLSKKDRKKRNKTKPRSKTSPKPELAAATEKTTKTDSRGRTRKERSKSKSKKRSKEAKSPNKNESLSKKKPKKARKRSKSPPVLAELKEKTDSAHKRSLSLEEKYFEPPSTELAQSQDDKSSSENREKVTEKAKDEKSKNTEQSSTSTKLPLSDSVVVDIEASSTETTTEDDEGEKKTAEKGNEQTQDMDGTKAKEELKKPKENKVVMHQPDDVVGDLVESLTKGLICCTLCATLAVAIAVMCALLFLAATRND